MKYFRWDARIFGKMENKVLFEKGAWNYKVLKIQKKQSMQLHLNLQDQFSRIIRNKLNR